MQRPCSSGLPDSAEMLVRRGGKEVFVSANRTCFDTRKRTKLCYERHIQGVTKAQTVMCESAQILANTHFGLGLSSASPISCVSQLFACRSVVLGRTFVKRFALFYRTVICSVSVGNVGVLRPNGWMHQDETWHGDRPRPRPHCVRWGPSSSQKGGTAPTFLPMSIVAKQLDVGFPLPSSCGFQ